MLLKALYGLVTLFIPQAVVLSIEYVANLTATDAYPVPGGYVVPVNDSITLHCEAQVPPYKRNTILQWNIAMSTYSRNGTLATDIAQEFSNKFTRVQTYLKNPTMLRIHNLQISENRSTVQCSVSNLANTGSQVITIFVEGKLICDNQSEDYV